MEDSTLLTKIGVVLVDALLDDVEEKGYYSAAADSNYKDADTIFPLLDSDDEAFTFFLKRQKLFQFENYKTGRKCKDEHKGNNAEHELVGNDARKRKVNSGQNLVLKVNLLTECDDSTFENCLHLSKDAFMKIYRILRNLLCHAFSNAPELTPQSVFSLALWKLATDEHFEGISRRFGIPLHSCHIAIRQFWEVISDNYEAFIKWPNTQRNQQVTLRDFQAITALRPFQNLYGIIVLQTLDIFLESKDEEVSVILQIVCNAKEKIIDCFVDFAAEYSFDSTPIGQTLELNTQTIPTDSFLIGCADFPLRRYLMRPFTTECFYNEAAFNRMLQPAIAVGQRVLDNMARQFHILYALEARDISEVRQVLESVCCLYNLCVDQRMNETQNESGRVLTATTHEIPKSRPILRGSEQNQQGLEMRYKLMEAITKQS